MKAIGDHFGCGHSSVITFCKKHGIEADRQTVSSGASNAGSSVAPPVPSPPHRLTVAHPGYAGKREDGQLCDEDWPDIKQMMAQGATLRSIASDFDVELEDLEYFIASSQRREAKQPPGESSAPLPSLTGGAS